MSQEQTLQQLLAERVSLFAASDKPKAMIDDHVEKMFKDVIADCFRSYGDMGKAVSAAIKSAMPANVEGMFELTRYNDLVATALREKWQASSVTGDLLRRAQEAFDEVMSKDAVPEFVSLRQLLEEFAESHKEAASEERWEGPRIDIEVDDRFGSKHIKVGFDPEPESSYRERRSFYSSHAEPRSRHQLKNYLAISVTGATDKGEPYGSVYHARLAGEPVGRNFCIHTRWEQLVAALYFGAAKLVIDCDADDISYGIYD